MLAELCNIPKEAFQECFQNRKKCWKQYIKSAVEYSQVDNAQMLQSKLENDLLKLFIIFMDRPHKCCNSILSHHHILPNSF